MRSSSSLNSSEALLNYNTRPSAALQPTMNRSGQSGRI
jgi:hypothetical protein